MVGQKLNANGRELVLEQALAKRAPIIAADPRPRPALRVGGIGHRKIPEDALPKVRASVARALASIENAGHVALSTASIAEQFDGAPIFAVITPLAEGADRLIAQAAEAMDPPWLLGAVLPFAKAAYEDTFDLDEDPAPAIAEFRRLLAKTALPDGYGALVLDGKSSTEKERNAGYRDASTAIIRWCDILIIVIERARLDSETGYGLKEALAWNVPIIVVDPGEPERFRLVLDGAELPDLADVDAALKSAVARTLGSASTDDSSHGNWLKDYLAERITYDASSPTDFEYRGPYTAHTVAPGWIAWGAAVNRHLRGTFKGLLLKKDGGGAVSAEAGTLPFDGATAARFVDSALHYNRADALARLYGDLHRGVQIVAVVVGVVAALVALIHAIDEELPAAIFTLFEFSCLVFMFAAVKTSHRQR